MKRFTTTLVFCSIFFTTLYSQITKGNWLFGGNLSYSRYKIANDLGGYTEIDIEAKGNAGYFIIDNLAAGLRPNLFFLKTKISPVNGKSNRSEIGPSQDIIFYRANSL